MLDAAQRQLREDCHASLATLPGLASKLSGQRIAVVGGTGFVGSWLAEAVAALNDDLGAKLRLDLLGRSASLWHDTRPHLKRDDVRLKTVDVRSAFELPRDTTLVLFAAGIADPRIHASDPHRVFQTNVYGLDHALGAAARLEQIQRFVNLSSGLVLGGDLPRRALAETDIGELDFTRFHNLYVEARRAAESLACAYAGQYRIPVSTARAFTFLGPYQPLDAPWALNNFIRDALAGNEIRIHGDGATRRSYLYGSDVAAWLLKALVDGRDGEVYNVGGEQPVTHGEAAAWVSARTTPSPELAYKSRPGAAGRNHDFYPDVTHTMRALGVRAAFDVQAAIERSMQWHAHAIGAGRRVRDDV
ncbi:MAG: NAD(P)-dependent oxidoreductase [Burkholderiales bacterium]